MRETVKCFTIPAVANIAFFKKMLIHVFYQNVRLNVSSQRVSYMQL